MPTLNNVAPSGKPSLFGLNPDSAAADTAVNNRVLAHLEGRKSSSSATAKYLGAGVLATAVLGAAGFYAWQKRTTPDESTVIAQAPAAAPAAPAVQPVPATPAAALAPTAAPAPEPSPQTARIVNDALPQAAPVDAKKSEQSPGQQDMAAGSAAPAHHATVTSTAAKRAEAKASSSHKEKEKERAKADGVVTAKAAKSAAKSKANSAQSQKPPAESDPDADLLTFLLQMRDPRKSPDTK